LLITGLIPSLLPARIFLRHTMIETANVLALMPAEVQGTEGRASMERPGRSGNLKRGRDKGDPPTRKLSAQKVTGFCLYYLTHGESVKAAALHMNIALTYAYEFFRKPAVQAKLEELRAALGEEVLQNAANSNDRYSPVSR